VDSNSVIKLLFGGPHLNSDTEALGDFSSVRPNVVDADNSIAGDVDNELAEACFRISFRVEIPNQRFEGSREYSNIILAEPFD
jgi:hypothetical protein